MLLSSFVFIESSSVKPRIYVYLLIQAQTRSIAAAARTTCTTASTAAAASLTATVSATEACTSSSSPAGTHARKSSSSSEAAGEVCATRSPHSAHKHQKHRQGTLTASNVTITSPNVVSGATSKSSVQTTEKVIFRFVYAYSGFPESEWNHENLIFFQGQGNFLLVRKIWEFLMRSCKSWYFFVVKNCIHSRITAVKLVERATVGKFSDRICKILSLIGQGKTAWSEGQVSGSSGNSISWNWKEAYHISSILAYWLVL